MKFPIWTKVTFKNCHNLTWIVDWFDIFDFKNSRKVSVSWHWFYENELIAL